MVAYQPRLLPPPEIRYHAYEPVNHEYHPPMTNTSSYLLMPFILAFLVFVFRFYSRESAASIKNPSFLLAIATVLIAFSYLILGVIEWLPPYSTAGYLTVGLILLATAITRMFMI